VRAVANPDGYDFTFQPDQRLWHKNLADNNHDGLITGVDGVDPNRNYATKWGYDNEGSSDSFTSETYRGPSPQSEPETRALDGAPSGTDNWTTLPEYGIEQLATPAERADVLGRIMEYLLA
jgi:hypothetical protein